ncbi:Uma2 family endonuclease [Tundrisphaera sp. TA3]|uniref:Uma2 family endonuclease n=1 Tax=Tundrisphaera sp. TA3 TaxID=3435775 RepID=UPI003EC117F6
MSTATIETHPAPAVAGSAFPRRRWTVAEFEEMIARGVMREGGPEFLWDGEICEAMSEYEPHVNAYNALIQALYMRLDLNAWIVRANNPLWLREGYLPNPDIVVLPGSRSTYKGRRPTAADAALVVEIANTSYPDDSRVMLPEYARGGVPQYWIVHINARRVEVYRDPKTVGDVGAYAPPVFYAMDAEVPLRLAPGGGQPEREFPPIPVAEILRDSLEEER